MSLRPARFSRRASALGSTRDNPERPSTEVVSVEAGRSASVGPAIRAAEATKVYGCGATAVRALDAVTLTLPAGELTGIMGPSGSGKSTLLHCLAGLDPLTSGEVFVGEVRLGSLDDDALTALRRERLGFVFQSFNLLPTLTASDNITLPARLAGSHPEPDWLRTVVEVTGLEDRLSHRPSELSGGEQQRVAVARALLASILGSRGWGEDEASS